MESNEIKFGNESTFLFSKKDDDQITVEGTLVIGDEVYFENKIDTYFYDPDTKCFATTEGLVLMLPDYEYGLLKEACRVVNILLF